jgi:zinc protease
MREKLFGDKGYGRDSLGTEESVRTMQANDVRDFHFRLGTPNNCVLAIYGDIRPEEVAKAIKNNFAGWKAAEGTDSVNQEGTGPIKGIRRFSEAREKKQAVVVVGYEGTTIADPDRYALELLQEACSDLGSRLFLRIREKLGLAYYVGAQNVLGLSPGYFAFYAGTMPEAVDVVERELLMEAELLRTEGLSAEELQRAKAKIIGQRKIARQDLGALAAATALDELYGLGFQHNQVEDACYEAVTLEQVRTVALKYLNQDSFVVSSIKPSE